MNSPLAVIFGGSGFIGSHLTSALRSRGWEILVADIVPPKADIDATVGYEYCDVRSHIDLHPGRRPEVVFNLAAVHRTPGHKDEDYFLTNVSGASHVTEWCARRSVNDLIFTSSISVYGSTEAPIDEFGALAPKSAYGRSKAIAEYIHTMWRRDDEANRRLVICRPAVIFGPNEGGNFTRLARALRQRRFVFAGRSDTIKSCGSVWDLVDSLMFVWQLGTGTGVFNFAYPERYTIREICNAFKVVAGYSTPVTLPIASLGRRMAGVPGPLGEAGERLLKIAASTNVLPGVLVREGFEWQTNLISALDRWYRHDPSGTFL